MFQRPPPHKSNPTDMDPPAFFNFSWYLDSFTGLRECTGWGERVHMVFVFFDRFLPFLERKKNLGISVYFHHFWPKSIEIIPKDSESISKDPESISKDSESISKDSESISKDSENMSKDSENISRDSGNISKDSKFWPESIEIIPKDSESISKDSENMSKDARNISTYMDLYICSMGL